MAYSRPLLSIRLLLFYLMAMHPLGCSPYEDGGLIRNIIREVDAVTEEFQMFSVVLRTIMALEQQDGCQYLSLEEIERYIALLQRLDTYYSELEDNLRLTLILYQEGLQEEDEEDDYVFEEEGTDYFDEADDYFYDEEGYDYDYEDDDDVLFDIINDYSVGGSPDPDVSPGEGIYNNLNINLPESECDRCVSPDSDEDNCMVQDSESQQAHDIDVVDGTRSLNEHSSEYPKDKDDGIDVIRKQRIRGSELEPVTNNDNDDGNSSAEIENSVYSSSDTISDYDSDSDDDSHSKDDSDSDDEDSDGEDSDDEDSDEEDSDVEDSDAEDSDDEDSDVEDSDAEDSDDEDSDDEDSDDEDSDDEDSDDEDSEDEDSDEDDSDDEDDDDDDGEKDYDNSTGRGKPGENYFQGATNHEDGDPAYTDNPEEQVGEGYFNSGFSYSDPEHNLPDTCFIQSGCRGKINPHLDACTGTLNIIPNNTSSLIGTGNSNTEPLSSTVWVHKLRDIRQRFKSANFKKHFFASSNIDIDVKNTSGIRNPVKIGMLQHLQILTGCSAKCVYGLIVLFCFIVFAILQSTSPWSTSAKP